MTRTIEGSTFVIATSGFADGLAPALRDRLVQRGALRLTVVTHPLLPEAGGPHSVTTFEHGRSTRREYRLPHRPPYTYVFDPFVPLRLPRCSMWFGFTNLAALRGLVRRRAGRAERVCYWPMDFVAARFGAGPATWAYERVDRLVCEQADQRFEVSQAALAARTESHRLEPGSMAPAQVVPMGTWVDRAPKADSSAWERQKLIYLGHLVERQGVATAIRSLSLLLGSFPKATLEVIGSGPLDGELRALATGLGLDTKVVFRGFVEDHAEVERLLAGATIGLAPYVARSDNFTRFADPGKLKAYLGAGIPIVLTDVPPNAHELEAVGAGVIAGDSPEAVAAASARLLADKALWLAAHEATLAYAEQFDWSAVLDGALATLGFS